MNAFQIASALTLGQSHQKLNYNCQDAYEVRRENDLIVGVVADGCGSGRYSEVGARLGVQFVAEFCKRNFAHGTFDTALLVQGVVEYLHQLCDLHQPADRTAFVEEHLLFTLVGFVVTPKATHVFYAGDGYILLNDKTFALDKSNRPPYLGRHLLGERALMGSESIPTAELQRLLIGTDGLRDLPVTIEALVNDARYFEHARNLPQQLQTWANAGQLKDDAAVIMLRA